jgi:hypothetical protein
VLLLLLLLLLLQGSAIARHPFVAAPAGFVLGGEAGANHCSVPFDISIHLRLNHGQCRLKEKSTQLN